MTESMNCLFKLW